MAEYRAVTTVLVMYHLLECEVTGRAPLGPLSRHRVVVTTQGSVRGYFAPRPPHYSYLGLPYARPPTHYDRFKAPEPPPRWSGIFEAIHRVKCPQPDGSGDENCLVVNVFTPEDAETAPVIVHIHDGGFQSGYTPAAEGNKISEERSYDTILSSTFNIGFSEVNRCAAYLVTFLPERIKNLRILDFTLDVGHEADGL
ncbi:carboxylesterase precursor [Danaus plexippus plexippus]|uniref:Carboxylesterase n=1 Tax=Danaus plexippus plexippus TaxID=278856 RepID=A0A212EH98_DANPL|nr:carboxylesterase precursor [Danaus plexippus plexippus]